MSWDFFNTHLGIFSNCLLLKVRGHAVFSRQIRRWNVQQYISLYTFHLYWLSCLWAITHSLCALTGIHIFMCICTYINVMVFIAGESVWNRCADHQTQLSFSSCQGWHQKVKCVRASNCWACLLTTIVVVF